MNNPKYRYGEEVRLVRNIRNDGSFQNSIKGECLMRRGNTGFVRHAGYFLQDQIVYQVHFLDEGITIGCKEEELVLASLPWQHNAFEYGDHATLNLALKMDNEIIAAPGDTVSIIAVHRIEPEIHYRVQLHDLDIMVPERALTAMEASQ